MKAIKMMAILAVIVMSLSAMTCIASFEATEDTEYDDETDATTDVVLDGPTEYKAGTYVKLKTVTIHLGFDLKVKESEKHPEMDYVVFNLNDKTKKSGATTVTLIIDDEEGNAKWTKTIIPSTLVKLKLTDGFVCFIDENDDVNLKGKMSLGIYFLSDTMVFINLDTVDDALTISQSKLSDGSYKTAFSEIDTVSLSVESYIDKTWKLQAVAAINDFSLNLYSSKDIIAVADDLIAAINVWEAKHKAAGVSAWIDSTSKILNSMKSADFEGVYRGPSGDLPFEGTITNESKTGVPWYVELDVNKKGSTTNIQELGVNFTESMLTDAYLKTDKIDRIFVVLDAIDHADLNGDNILFGSISTFNAGIYGFNIAVENKVFTISADLITADTFEIKKCKFDKFSAEGVKIEFELKDAQSTDDVVEDIAKVLNHLKNVSISVDALYGSIDDIVPEEQNGVKVDLNLTFLGIGAYIGIDNSDSEPIMVVKTSNNATGKWNGGIKLDGKVETTFLEIPLEDAYVTLNAEVDFVFVDGVNWLAAIIKELFEGRVSDLIKNISGATVNELTLTMGSTELLSIKELVIDIEREFATNKEVTETMTNVVFKQDSYLQALTYSVNIGAGFQLTLDRDKSGWPTKTNIGFSGKIELNEKSLKLIEEIIEKIYPEDRNLKYYIENGNAIIHGTSTDSYLISISDDGVLSIDLSKLPGYSAGKVDEVKITASYYKDTISVSWDKSTGKVGVVSMLGNTYGGTFKDGKISCEPSKLITVKYGGTDYKALKGTPLSSVIPIPEGADVGKKFDHWEYNGKRVDVFSDDLDGKTLTAKYTTTGSLEYTIVYNANLDGVTPVEVKVKYGDGTYAVEQFSTDWTLKCWNTNKDGSGASYYLGDDVSRLTSANGGKVYLYAQWTADITLTYGDKSKTITVEYGKKYGAGLDAVSSSIMNFKRWYTDDASKSTITSSDKVKAPVDLVAEIVEAPASKVVVTIVVTDDMVVGPMTKYSVGVTFSQVLDGIDVPDIDGYVFSGWYTADDNRAVVMSDRITEDVKIVALWIAEEYDITVSGVSIGKQKYDSVFNIPAAASKKGYVFINWKVVSDGKTNYLEEGSSIVVRDDVELTPVFGKCETLKVNITNGTGSALVTVNGVPITVDAAKGCAEFKDAYGAQYISVVYGGEEVYCKTVFIDGKDRSGVKEVEVDLSKDVKTSVIVEEDAKGAGVMPVEGLDQAGTATGKVEYTLVVSVTGSEFAIKTSEALGKDYSVTESVGLSIYQTADGKTTVLSTTAEMQTIYIEITQQVLSELSMSGYDLDDILVYRSHGNDVEEIPYGSAYSTRECYYFSADKKYVVLHVDKFSDYGIAIPNNRMVYVDYTTGGIAYADTKTAEKGDTVTLTAEARIGYTFVGWYSNDVTIVDGKFVMPDKNVSVYASFMKIPEPERHTVTFEYNDGRAPTTVQVQDGDTVSKPADPTRAGYTFAGWYMDEGLTTEYDFSDPVTSDITIYAKWKAAVYHTVTFEYNDGRAPTTVQVQDGETVSKPADPTRAGYTFAGWYANKGLTVKYDFSDPVTSDITIYAKWEAAEVYHTVTLEFNNGTERVSFQVEDGKTFKEPTAPSRSGYDFAGWYANKGLTVKYDFSKPVTSDITIYAKWDSTAPEKKDNTMTYVAIAAVVVIALLAVGGFVFYKRKNV